MHPCPALLDQEGIPYGPVRTNYFPQPQLTLASTLDRSRHDLTLLDLRTLQYPEGWPTQLGNEYADPIPYGDRRLTRHLVGDYEAKVASSATDVDIYILSANFTYEANAVRQTIRLLKQHNHHALILVGGTDASPRERHHFYFDAGADFIGVGDGDVSLSDFVTSYLARTEQERYPNGVFTDAGRIHCIDVSLVQSMHADPARFSESGGGSILPAVLRKGFAAYIETQRGCNRTCEFCYAASTPFNRLSVPDVKLQIDNYIANGVALFMFTDDNTLLRREGELIEIFEYLRQREVAWEFPNGLEFGLLGRNTTSGEWSARTELVESMFWNNGNLNEFSGAHRLLFPVEDSLLRTSSLLKLRTGGAKETLDRLLETKIPYINIGIMIGAWNETEDERKRLRCLLQQYATIASSSETSINYSIFCTMPLPGTGLGRRLCEEHRVKYDINRFPELWNVFISVVDGVKFSAENTTLFRREILAEHGMDQSLGKVKGRRAGSEHG